AREDEEIGQLIVNLVRLDRLIRLAPFQSTVKEILLEDTADLERAIMEDFSNVTLLAIFNRMYRMLQL
ncbi:hypothetical protein HDU91_003729, partial [Kappamyces sp. JEL0680]